MQLIWVSGPTARVFTLSITRGKVLLALAATVVVLLLLGGVFQLVGLRVAVAHVPALAQTVGGVASLEAQQRLEADYNARLVALQQQLGQTVERLQQMESHRQAFFARIGLGSLTQPLAPTADKSQGRGGPFKALPAAGVPIPQQLSDAARALAQVQGAVAQTHAAWSRQQSRLEAVPLALPIQDDFRLTSGFGVRADPMTHQPSLHEGIDFVAPVSTPVVATAPGEVVVARYSGAYGNLVEVAHAEGFVTRYAHLQTLLVQPGDRLRAGDRLGLLGNTGRSTSAHLHYEVLYRGQPMHPVTAMQAWSRS